MRVPMLVLGLMQAAPLTACDDFRGSPKSAHTARAERTSARRISGSDAAAANRIDRPVSLQEIPLVSQTAPLFATPWSRALPSDPTARLIVRTGQASLEVDSLETAMLEVRRLMQRVGGFVA